MRPGHVLVMGMRAMKRVAAILPRALICCTTALIIAVGAGTGQALWAAVRVAAEELCGPSMPERAGFARGYMFTGILVAKHPETVAPPAWDFMVERIHAGEGNVAPPGDPYHVQFEEGKILTLDDRCYPPRGLRIGKRYLVSIAAIGSFASQSTVVWEVRPHGRVRLLRQYHSKPVATWRTYPSTRRMDPRLLGPRTVREAIALMMPPGELPPTDTGPPDTAAQLAASVVVRTMEAWLEAILRVVASFGPRASP